MPRQKFKENYGEIEMLLSEVSGLPKGSCKVLEFDTFMEATAYRQRLYQTRSRAKWPEGGDPWGEINMCVKKKTEPSNSDPRFCKATLILSKWNFRPDGLPVPLSKETMTVQEAETKINGPEYAKYFS